jgi:hypothetical protein
VTIRQRLLVYLLYLAIAILITWPLATVMATHFAGYRFGDAHEMTRHIWWIKHALQTGQPLIFQPLLGYPDGIPGVILWSDPLQFFPGWLFAFVMPLPAAYNLFVWLTLALNGWAAYYLVWKLTNVRPAALIGGLVFLAAPTMQGHLAGGHGGLLVQWPLVLFVASLQSLANSHQPPAPALGTRYAVLRPSNFVLCTLFFFLTPLGHTLQLIYAVMPLVAVAGITLLARRDWRALLRLLVVCMVGSALLLIFLLPVFSATFGSSAYTGEGGGVDFSADLLSVVTPSFNHPILGQLDFTHRVLGVNIVEGFSYIGIIPAVLGLVAVWKARAARWWLGLAVVAYLLSLGPLLKVFDTPVTMTINGYETHITLPWALVYDLPGFSLARTPGRFNILLALAVAVMAGYGVSELKAVSRQLSAIGLRLQAGISRIPLRLVLNTRPASLAATLLAALILLDYQSFWPLPTYSAEIPQAVYDLAKREDVRAVFDVPWDNLLTAKDALWLQTAHQKPMIAGQVTRRTPVSPAKLNLLGTRDPYLLKMAGADVLIVHKRYHADLSNIVRDHFGQSFYEDEALALFNIPDVPPPVSPMQLAQAGHDLIERYFYAPQAGWVELQNLGAGIISEGRPVSVQLDGQAVYRWQPGSPAALNLWLPVRLSGFHGITISPEPPCAPPRNPTLRCLAFGYRDDANGWIHVSDTEPADFASVQFGRGLELAGTHIVVPESSKLVVALWWRFDQPRAEQDIRFIKVLDEQGEPIAGVDETLGAHGAGSEWVETVRLDLPSDLPDGTYRIYVGWYTYPDLTRFPVLSDVEGARDSLALVGEFNP